ncbi:hypothetical protein ACP3TB_13670 [Rahnella variigena]|uniref:hypothetical protein n=1 Tax=Rahnella variigena TaxID=574964 RepID=UPI003CEA7161
MTDTTEQEFNFDAFMYGVRCDSPFDGSTLADSISDDEVRRAESAFNSLLKRAEKAEKSNAFLKEQLAQLANFNPDWDMLEACRESWREVVALLKEREAELAALKGDQVPVAWIRERAIDKPEHKGKVWRDISYPVKPEPAAVDGVYHDVIIPLYDRPQKPVVLPSLTIGQVMHRSGYDRQYAEGWVSANDTAIREIKAAGGIVKDGE